MHTVQDMINKALYDPGRAFRDLWFLAIFWKFSNTLAYGSCNFQNFLNINGTQNDEMHLCLHGFL